MKRYNDRTLQLQTCVAAGSAPHTLAAPAVRWQPHRRWRCSSYGSLVEVSHLVSRASKPSAVEGFQIEVVRVSPKRLSSCTMTYTVFPSGTARPLTMYTLMPGNVRISEKRCLFLWLEYFLPTPAIWKKLYLPHLSQDAAIENMAETF